MQPEGQLASATMNRLDLDVVRKESGHTGTYMAALAATAFVLPIITNVISAVAYVTQWPWGLQLPYWIAPLLGSPLLIGALPILLVWLLFAVPYRRFTAVNHANTRSYNSLLKRLYQLDVRLQLLDFELHIESGNFPEKVTASSISTETNAPEYRMHPSGNSLMPIINRTEAYVYRNATYNRLKSKNIPWMLATAYINLWKLMQLAEEALIEVSPRAVVIREALHDKACIQHSNIKNSEELVNKLMRAVKILDAREGHLKQLSYNQYLVTQEDSRSMPTSADTAAEAQARTVLRAVRHALNQFRNSRWEAMIRTRNHIIYSIVLIGLIIYLLIDLAIIINIPRSAIILAIVFYLAGAIAGLFSRLYKESQANRSIDDYGLTAARLVVTPMFTGIAGIGGVLVVQQGNLFDPKHLLVGLVVAAICGIISNFFINALQKQAERYKADLKSVQATVFPERGEGLLSVNEPQSLLSRIAHTELEQGIIVRGQRIDASQPSLLETARARLEEAVRWPRTKELELSLFAITRIDLEEENSAFVDKAYSLEVGLSLSKSGNFNDESSGGLSRHNIDDIIEFDLLFHGSENIKLIDETEWHKRLLFMPNNLEPQFVELMFQVIAPGHSSLVIDFFYEQRWLRTTRLEFDAIEKPN